MSQPSTVNYSGLSEDDIIKLINDAQPGSTLNISNSLITTRIQEAIRKFQSKSLTVKQNVKNEIVNQMLLVGLVGMAVGAGVTYFAMRPKS